MGEFVVALLALIFGVALLVWSADRFIDGAAATARHFGVPPLIIGMVIVGCGTSIPEMLVSALAVLKNSPGIAIRIRFQGKAGPDKQDRGACAVIGLHRLYGLFDPSGTKGVRVDAFESIKLIFFLFRCKVTGSFPSILAVSSNVLI